MAKENKSKGNVPNMRFTGFEGEWASFRLGEIATFSKGKGISKSDVHDNGNTECIRYGELYTHYGETIDKVKSKTNVDVDTLILSEANDVIIPASGETMIDIATASCVLKSGVALGGDLNIIKTKNDGVFLSYYLNSKKKLEIANLAQGISVVHLYSSQLSSLSLRLPTLEEQKRISIFFATLDKRIQTQNKIIEQLETLIKGLSEKLFTQTIRLKNFSNRWELIDLGDICDFHKGSPLSKSDIVKQGNLKCIHYGELFTLYKAVISNIISLTNTSGFKSKIGDVLMPSSDVTPLGLATASVILEDNVVLGGDINVLRPKSNINPTFLSYLLNTEKKKIINLVSGTTVKHIYSKDLRKIKLYIPRIEEQNSITQFLVSIDVKIQIEKSILDKYKTQKRFLLYNLFI